MKHASPRIFPLLILLALAWSTAGTGCGFGPEGYGVVLLSPNEDAVSTGAVVTVEESSDLNETYILGDPDSDRSIEIDMWRIRFFEQREAAEEYARSYSEYTAIFAENLRDGLAVREEPTVNSQRLYKMRIGQEVKVLGRQEQRVTVGSHTGYWYRVLTKDGVQGYCFDHYLEIYDINEAPEQEEEPDLERIREVLQQVYRPIDYELMVEAGQIKLEKFTRTYGFFPEPEEKRFEVRTFDYSHSFEYSEIRKQSERSYLLAGSGVELRIEDERRITLIYTKDDRNYSPGFVLIDDLEEIREEERQRREELLTELLEHGPSYHSSAYGSLRFAENGTFVWERFDRLVPGVIPSEDLRGGDLRFDHFVGTEVGGGYQGAFSLAFNGMSGEPPVFLYTLEEDKLTIEYVSERNIEEMVVLRRNASPLIMAFFSES